MQPIPRGREQRAVIRPEGIVHQPKDAPEQDQHDRELRHIPDKSGQMKPERVQSSAEPVVERERGRHKWTPGPICWQHAESRRVSEEPGNVAQTPYIRVLNYGMRIIEVERVSEMIGVACNNRDGHQSRRAPKPSGTSLTVHAPDPCSAPSRAISDAWIRPGRAAV